jgi:type II secretory pathway pseudopilin PulG
MKNERGITIIETTVILSVLFILAGVMSPIVSESIMTARAVKAKSDASMIAMGLINFQKDVGAGALALTGTTGGGAQAQTQAVGLTAMLVSDGDVPALTDEQEQSATFPAMTLLAQTALGGARATGSGNGSSSTEQRRLWREAPADSLDDHLRHNRKGYRFRQPGEYDGWNGPYLSAPIAGDPWGNRYLINAGFLDGGTTAADSNGRLRRAVFVVSAGGNGVIETPFEQPVIDARAYGDDIVIRIQ